MESGGVGTSGLTLLGREQTQAMSRHTIWDWLQYWLCFWKTMAPCIIQYHEHEHTDEKKPTGVLTLRSWMWSGKALSGRKETSPSRKRDTALDAV